jgi:hypothetical protein
VAASVALHNEGFKEMLFYKGFELTWVLKYLVIPLLMGITE